MPRMKLQKLNDVFPEWLSGGGIFSALQSFPVPWKNENISAFLDIEYHGNNSGDKIISPLVNKMKAGETLSAAEKTMIATAIMALNGVNWGKQWETLSFVYDPIENYHMVENMTDDETVIDYGKSTTRTDNLTHSKTGTETETPDLTNQRTDNLTDTITPNLTTNTSNTVNGFNSTTGVPAGSQTGTETGTRTETNTGTQTARTTGENETEYNLSESDTGTQTILDGGQDTHTRNYELTRSGNIGVTTSQQMIESERELWKWNFFRNVVFPDVDRVLTIQVY